MGEKVGFEIGAWGVFRSDEGPAPIAIGLTRDDARRAYTEKLRSDAEYDGCTAEELVHHRLDNGDVFLARFFVHAAFHNGTEQDETPCAAWLSEAGW